MNLKRIGSGCLVLAFLVMAAGRASAVITYADATSGAAGNTAIAPSAGGGVFNPLATQGPGGDAQWDVRVFGNGGTIFQNAAAGAVDNAPRLVTTVTGLPSATYNVYAYFWSDTSAWRMGASLTDLAGALPLFQFNPTTAGVVQFYSGADATVLSNTLAPNPFTTSVMIGEGNRRLFQIPLGTTTGTQVRVFVDDSPTQADANQRTWYDGVGYELIPEPTSLALMAVFAPIAALARRSRRRG